MERNALIQHRWGDVTSAVWRKYPHPDAPHVRTVDTADARLEDGKLHVTRLVSYQRSPWPTYYGFEHIVVDPVSKIMTMDSCNLTGRAVAQVRERCTYSASPDGSTELKVFTEVRGPSFIKRMIQEGAERGVRILTDRITRDLS